MNDTEKIFEQLYMRYPTLAGCDRQIRAACRLLLESIQAGGKLLLCGNGGSSADCEHISGELLKGFLLNRRLDRNGRLKFAGSHENSTIAENLQYGICAIPLSSFSSVFTAYINDVAPTCVFAQLVFALGKSGDTVLCISTSGNSENICNAARAAKASALHTIGLTGENGGALRGLCDICIQVPGTETFMIQELHLPVYHCICAVLESELFGGLS